MRFASPLRSRSSPPPHGASILISGCFTRNLGSSRCAKQPRRRHLRSASTTTDDKASPDLDPLFESTRKLDRARFPLLTSPRSPVAHFVNLTNGLEAVPFLLRLGIDDFSMTRLTSTACEQRRHADFLNEVDVSLLAALAAGKVVLVWDTSSRERGASGGSSGNGEDKEEDDCDDKEWKEALLSDKKAGGEEDSPSSSSSSSRAGGGLRVPRALFWGLEFLRYACETRWGDGANAAAGARKEEEGGGGEERMTATTTSSPPSPPPPRSRAFLGESGHDVTLDFEQALRKEVPDRTKARLRYFKLFYHQQQLQQQTANTRGNEEENETENQPLRLWGCYRPSRLDRGGGDEASRRAQQELFELAFSSRSRGGGSSGGGEKREGEEEGSTSRPRFSREALALELAELGWGLFTGGADRAERLRASRRRREAKGGK